METKEAETYIRLAPVPGRSRRFTFATLDYGNMGKFETKADALEGLLFLYRDGYVDNFQFRMLCEQVLDNESLGSRPPLLFTSFEELSEIEPILQEDEQLIAFTLEFADAIYPYASCDLNPETFLPLVWVDDRSNSFKPHAYVLLDPPSLTLSDDGYTYSVPPYKELYSREEVRKYLLNLQVEGKISEEDHDLLYEDTEESELPEKIGEIPQYFSN